MFVLLGAASFANSLEITPASAELFAEIPSLEKISFGEVREPDEMLARLRELRPSIQTRR